MMIDKVKKLSYKIILHKATQNFIIIALISLVQIISNVLLGRELSKDDYGQFSFIFNNIIRVWSILFLFGQSSSILRLFSSVDIQEFKWKKKLIMFLLVISVPLTLATYLIAIFYQLTSIMFIIAVFCAFITCCTMMLSSIYRSQGKFNTAVIMERVNPIVFMILLLYPYLISKNFDLITVSLLKLISLSVVIPFLMYILLKWKEGHRQIKKETMIEGLTLWELSLSVIVLTNIDAFFIVKILNYQELALYSIVLSIMIIYDFAREAIFNVYSQKYATKNQDSAKLIKIVILISAVLTIFYIISTNFILQILFNGKYIASILLIILSCVYSSLNLFYVIPSCYLVGQGSKQELRKMMAINIISIVVKIIFIFIFMKAGLSGFLIACIISQGVRVAGAYSISFKYSYKT